MMAAACATPYQASGFRGGYEDRDLGGGRWMISVEVNSYTSRSTAAEYTYRRAGELCPYGFDLIDADRSSRNFYASFDGGKTVQNMPKSSAMLIVQCRSPVLAPRPVYVSGPPSGASEPRADAGDPQTWTPERPPRWAPGEQPAPAPAPSTPTPPTTSAGLPTKLLIFGGANHRTFLGCLCSEFDSDSVLNKYGTFGNPYSSETIWNKYGDYGSRYSDTSVCNRYATNPPVVVTSAGDFMGFLTLDRYKSGAITEPAVLAWLEKTVCEQ